MRHSDVTIVYLNTPAVFGIVYKDWKLVNHLVLGLRVCWLPRLVARLLDILTGSIELFDAVAPGQPTVDCSEVHGLVRGRGGQVESLGHLNQNLEGCHES